MRLFLVLMITLITTGCATYAGSDNGIIRLNSAGTVKQTSQRLTNLLEEKGFTVFNTINHAAGAAGVGISLRPTILIIFGNPKGGAPLMQCQQMLAIDLPQKALIYQDDDQKVWLAYNDPGFLASRHDVDDCDAPLRAVSAALDSIARTAASGR